MSALTGSARQILEKIVKDGVALEMFPGNDTDSNIHESVDLLYELTGNQVFTLGDGDFSGRHVTHHNVRIPPYPDFQKKFKYILINEIYWAFAEHGYPLEFKEPSLFLRFVVKHIETSGFLLISKTDKIEADALYKYIPTYANVSYNFEEDVAVFCLT